VKKTVGIFVVTALLGLPASASAIQADLQITASDSPDPVTLGGDLTYTYSVANNASDTASSNQLTTAVPGGTTFQSLSAPGWTTTTPPVGGTGNVTATKGSLAGGATSLLTFVVHTTAAGQISNSAAVTTSTPEGNTANNTATTLTTVLALPVPAPTTTTPAATTTSTVKKCKKRHRHAAAKRCKKKH